MSEEKALAERCFDSDLVDEELFRRVNLILGCDEDKCLDEGFVWGASDVYWDYYDRSVEVIRPKESEWMTEDQAEAILNLGFACIYESIGEEGKLRYMRDKSGSPCCSRDYYEETKRTLISKQKVQLKKAYNSGLNAAISLADEAICNYEDRAVMKCGLESSKKKI